MASHDAGGVVPWELRPVAEVSGRVSSSRGPVSCHWSGVGIIMVNGGLMVV